MKKTICKYLISFAFALTLICIVILFASNTVLAAKTYQYNSRDDYWNVRYPGTDGWGAKSGMPVAFEITATADPDSNSPAQELSFSSERDWENANWSPRIYLNKGYTGDVTWVFKSCEGYTPDFKDVPWIVTLHTGDGPYDYEEIPMYGYSHEYADSIEFRVHFDNYDGSWYNMNGLTIIDNTWRYSFDALVGVVGGDGNNPKWPTKAPARVAEDEKAYQAVSGDAIYQTPTYSMYRLKNPTTGEHFFTANSTEAANVKKAGWIDETPTGGAWKAPIKSDAPVYRLYNPNKKTCNHLYSMNSTEMANLKRAGWKVEGIAYYSDTNKSVPIYREYNKKTGDHNYTTDLAEHNRLTVNGWTAEGIAWYGVK